MLKNSELTQISKVITLLTAVKLYAIESDDFYNKTGVTVADLDRSIRNLHEIHAMQVVGKAKISMASNEYKKKHRKHANIIQNINNARHRKDQKKLEYWTNKLKECDENE